jgi:uncharacterized protein YcaQ
MPKAPSLIRAEQIARIRLRRHHLLSDPPVDAVSICRNVCGVQAQVMTAAYLQLWTRNHSITRAEIDDALWKKRTLVKTWLMRQTLHLVPTDEFPLYIAALKSCRVNDALRVMARFGISREEGEALTPVIMDVLSAGPLTRSGVADGIRPKASERVRAWMEMCFSHVRIPVAEGLVCYGRGENNDVTFARVDQWLPRPKRKTISPTEAQCALLRKYLRAYGPATLSDFAHWSGIPMREVKALRPLPGSDVSETSESGKTRLLLRDDEAVLRQTSKAKIPIRLLPNFDVYLLAHREKAHLLGAQHYKRVYRNQGWISPVVLINGEIAGVWSHRLQNQRLHVSVEPFGKFSKVVRAEIKREAEDLAEYFGSELSFQII